MARRALAGVVRLRRAVVADAGAGVVKLGRVGVRTHATHLRQKVFLFRFPRLPTPVIATGSAVFTR